MRDAAAALLLCGLVAAASHATRVDAALAMARSVQALRLVVCRRCAPDKIGVPMPGKALPTGWSVVAIAASHPGSV
jgi:hypothetical protein